MAIQGLMRTHHCGELREGHVGQVVQVCGWVNKDRDLGGLHFIDLRDKYGLVQLNFEDYTGDLNLLKLSSLESVVYARGKVRARPKDAQNLKMATGMVEVMVEEFRVLSQADTEHIPFLPYGTVEATENQKLKYRYLDLRTEKLQNILKLRSDTTFKVRELLTSENFIEVETPILYKSTPEGARDYIVPSRVHPGKVYALPQSPQTLKQLLMIGGTDKYFQICRCFRDEDLRADRQPEFSQIDIEVSFVTQTYIKNLAEKLVAHLFNLGADFKLPTMTFAEAMDVYGSDKPDTRFGLKHINVTELFKASEFAVLANPANNGGLIKAMFVPLTQGNFTRKDTDGFVEIVKPYGGKGVAFFKTQGAERSGGIAKFISEDIYQALVKKLAARGEQAGDGTWLFFADTNPDIVHASADALRRHLGKKLNLFAPGYHFLWVEDFPLFEWSEEDKRLYARHHPFTMVKLDELALFMQGSDVELKDCLAQAYDVVCNGYEIGGGSIRIYAQDVQDKMFKALKLTPEETQRQFGFFLEALKYGTPPHGGIAFGLDRIIMLLAQTDSIRDVMAFPKTTSAMDLMAGSPSRPADEQIHELHFRWREEVNQQG